MYVSFFKIKILFLVCFIVTTCTCFKSIKYSFEKKEIKNSKLLMFWESRMANFINSKRISKMMNLTVLNLL